MSTRHDRPFRKLAVIGAGDDPQLGKALAKMRTKAPVALRLSARLIDEGSRSSLEDGLESEIAHLEEIFGTRDAYDGLSSLGRKKPVFEGR